MKFLITLCFTLSLVTLAWTSSASWGIVKNKDYVLLREYVVRRSYNGSYLSINVHYPKFNHGEGKNISAINVFDRIPNNFGAIPTLLSGGPGYNFTTVNLISSTPTGIDSVVEIYGR